MYPTSMFLPSASSPLEVAGPSAIISPASTWSPVWMMGLWFKHVPWLERSNFLRGYSCTFPVSSSRIRIRSEATPTAVPAFFAYTSTPESRAIAASMPVATTADSVVMRGTAWRCMLEPMRARLVSSFSRKGMSAVATDTSCLGETSMYPFFSGPPTTLSGVTWVMRSLNLHPTWVFTK